MLLVQLRTKLVHWLVASFNSTFKRLDMEIMIIQEVIRRKQTATVTVVMVDMVEQEHLTIG